MKLARVLYLVALIICASSALIFYYHYQLREGELKDYQQLSRYSRQLLKDVNARLAQSREDLEQSSRDLENATRELENSLKEITGLNEKIVLLESDKTRFAEQLQALKEQRQGLENKIARLIEEKGVLEQDYSFLEQKFHSLDELKKAIRIVKIEQRKMSKDEMFKRRLANIEKLKRLDELALKLGNRGFLVKSGRSTFKQRTKIKVELEPIDSF